MRALAKLPKPDVLVRNEVEWLREYLEATTAGVGQLPHRWTHAKIREALLSETDGRCAYCDAIIRVVAFGDVEHMRPRKHFPELVVDWSNLTLACPMCNNTKRAKWRHDAPYVDPYVDNIAQHLVFVGPFIFGVSPRGRVTVKDVGLDSLAKTKARQEQIEAVMAIFALWNVGTESDRALLEEQIAEFVRSTPFRASVESALRGAGFAVTSE